ncbi:MAG: hypothetical protein WBV41_21575, partial [Terriglobales bacterium]
FPSRSPAALWAAVRTTVFQEVVRPSYAPSLIIDQRSTFTGLCQPGNPIVASADGYRKVRHSTARVAILRIAF